MHVWQDFVAGADPTDSYDKFTARIEFKNGQPTITWEPDLNTNGVVRSYVIEGMSDLVNGARTSPTNSSHRFLRVKVEMP